MKSIFLKLSSFRFGAARRHCPFRSIIHKPISLFLALIIFFLHVILVPVSVEASALPSGFKPYIRPVYNTTITDLQEAYNTLSGDELTIFLILAGAYVFNYAGLGDFGLVFEDPPTDATLKERLEFTGQQLIDTLFLPQNLFNAVFDPILSYLQGCITKAKNTDIEDFNNDLGGGGAGTSFGVLLPYDDSLILSFNEFFALQSGLYNWQNKDIGFTSSAQPFYVNYSDPVKASLYNSCLYSLGIPYIKFALQNSYSPYIYGAESILLNLFIDVANNQIYLVDLNGEYHAGYDLNAAYIVNDVPQNGVLGFGCPKYNSIPDFGNYKILVQHIFDNPKAYDLFNYYTRGYNCAAIFDQAIINKIYYGLSWDSRTEITNTSDLGYTDSNSSNLEVPKAPTLLDLSSVIEAIQGLNADLNDLRTVILENSYNQSTGNIVVQNDFDLNSLSQIIPESGIVVPEGLFGSSKGFIDYLWYMTKPLVQYTHDFIGTMWFDGVDGFDFSGPAPIVFGVITLGLIGGLIVKFLL